MLPNPHLSFEVIDDNISVRGMSRPWICTTVQARIGDKVIGHVHATHVTEETMKESYPTPWHFMSKKKGWCCDMSDPAAVWSAMHRHGRIAPEWFEGPSFNVTAKCYPGPDQAEKDLTRLLRVLDKRGDYRSPTKLMVEFFEFHSRPFVDFACVDDEYRRQGIATAMYEVLAKHLSTKGLCLWEGLSNGCSGPLWEKMRASGRLPVSYQKRPGGDKMRHCMDYRDKVAKAA